MKNVILIHGWNTKTEFFDPDKPTASNDHWFPWLTKQLMIKGIKADAPEMPEYQLSTYESWLKEVERFDINSDTSLVGHSCGGGFIVRYLSEHDITVDKVILIAPWLGIDPEEKFDEKFFDFVIDPNVAKKAKNVTIFVSGDDFDTIHKSVDKIVNSIDGVKLIKMSGKGHFTRTSLGTEAFPELLEEMLR